MEPPNTQTLRPLERAIVRYLDGELDEPARLALAERLKWDESARRMLRDYAAVDRLSTEALLAALDAPAVGGARPAAQPRGLAILRPAIALAAAAVLAAMVWPMLAPQTPPGRIEPGGTPVDPAPVTSGMWAPQPGEELRLGPPEDFGGGRGQRQVDRQVYGVFDQKENRFYVLEVDRVQTQVRQASWDY